MKSRLQNIGVARGEHALASQERATIGVAPWHALAQLRRGVVWCEHAHAAQERATIGVAPWHALAQLRRGVARGEHALAAQERATIGVAPWHALAQLRRAALGEHALAAQERATIGVAPWHALAQLRRALSTLVAALTLILASACAPPQSGSHDRVELTYWRTLTGGAGEAQDELVDRFNASQDSARVTSTFQGGYGDLATKMMTAAIADAGPDVSQLGTYEIRQFAQAGILADLRPYLDGVNGMSTSDWPETLVRAGEVDGGIYWLPFNVTVPILYYNPDAFDEAGIDAPPQTWTEFYDTVRKLTKRDASGRVTRYGLALWNITWPLLSAIWSEGGELTSRDYSNITLDDPRAVDVMTQFQDLVRAKAAFMPDAASGGHRAAFTSGRAAMILDSPAPFDEIVTSANGFAPKIALYPAGAKGRVYAPGGGGIVMLANTPEDRRDAAWQFMRYLLQPEQIAHYAERSGYTAFTTTSQQTAGGWLQDEQRAIIHSALPHLRGDFSVNVSPAIRTAFDEAFQRIMIKLDDPRTALRDADKQAEKNIQDELE